MVRKPTYKESEQKVKEPEQKRMNFIHKITSVLTGSRFYFHSLVPCLLAVSLAFYICFVGTITVEAEDQKRVLILHSYHIGYPWTDNVSEGITSILNKEENVEIIYEHMDTKRYVDKPYLKKLLHIYKYKYSGAIPDVIICSDDNALNFLLKNRDELFTRVPIVFCGINNFTDSRIAGHKNITGVVENPDILGTLQIALRLHRGTRQVAVVHDQTKSALANIERLRKIAPDFEKQVEFKYLTDVTISELREALRALPAETVVLHLSFARDRVGVFLPLKEASKLVNDNSAGPVYTCWDVRMSYPGHCGGKVVSGRMQGETAAQMAWRILHGESTDSIDIVRESPNVYMFDYEQVKRFGLSKNDLPENSIIVNEPFSFYEKYKGRIWITTGSFVFLLFLIVFLTTNILRRKRVEEALRIERDNLRNIFESMEDGIYIVNQQYDIQYVNPVLIKIFGPYEDIKCYRYFHDRDEVCPWCKNQDVWAGKTVRWEWYSFKNERTYDLIDTPMTLSDGSIGKLEIFRDISEQKQAKEALRKSEKRFREILEDISGIAIQGYDEERRVTFWNQASEKLYGYTENEALGKKLEDLIIPSSMKEEVKRLHHRWIEYGEKIPAGDLNLVDKKGNDVPVYSFHTMHDTPHGKEMFCIDIDLKPIRQAEEAFRESERRYRELINSITDFIYSHDLEGRFVTVNRAAAKTLGYVPKDLIGRPISDFMLPEYRQAFKEEYLEQIKEKGSTDGVTIYLAKDRSKHYIEYRSVLVKQERMEPFISGSGRDITEKVLSERKVQRLQEQLQRSQKMEALGLMAGGIAHDLNNILSGIVSYPDLLLMDLPEDSPLRKPIEIIQNSGQRAAAVVSDLLTVARGVATGKEVLNLNTVIEEYLQSPEHKKLATMRPSITFKTQLDSDLLNISCSSSHIKKSLMNLITNASEAIEDRGNVIVSTINMYLDEPIKGYEDIRRGEYAVMTVSDDGSGISPEDLERIFEPFYTKKVMGRSGTGLGLAVVWNTVQDHEGYINVKTGEDGTTFELYFPITREEVTAEEGQVPIEDYMGHGEKILVVDDEENQRKIACGLLAKLGYTTEAVSSGEEAIEYLKDNSADLLVLDMIMDPGIDGLETYKRILELNPGQKAIIASGFSETDRVKEAQRLGAGKYIKKPYTLEKIGLAVREELEK